jgi:hypothetical protein
MKIPHQFTDFRCEDYFEAGYASDGFWSEMEQIWLIEPISEIFITADSEFLQVGRPGVDGIGFGYRRLLDGLWAFHPQESRFQYVALDVASFVKEWGNGTIKV